MAIGNQMCIHDELSIPNKHKYKTSGPLYCKHTNVLVKELKWENIVFKIMLYYKINSYSAIEEEF